MNQHSARERALEIAERIEGLGPVSVVRFFSGAGLLAQGVQFGFVIRGSLYLRVDDASRTTYQAMGAAPFSYPGRSKTVTVASYYEAPGEVVDDSDELGRWAADALRAALAAQRGKAARNKPARRKPAR
jgi:DNA transformation protein and related proteins